jgi:RNA polymerase sporulation-specific sigma factor
MHIVDRVKLMLKIIKKILNLFIKNNEVNYINGSETLLPPLDKEKEEYYISRLKYKDLEARNKLIEHNLRLVVFIARKYETDLYNLEDLISIGTLGLIKGIQTFNADKNIKLATYASRCIENEILMFMRKKSKMKAEVSLDEPLNIDYDGNELLLQDILTTNEHEVEDNLEYNEKRKLMYDAIKELKDKEKEILILRYGLKNNEEMTQKEVADFLGISQSYISRLEKKIIKKLKFQLNK